MFGLGMPELIVIFLVMLGLFGAKALQEIEKGIGQDNKTFKREAKDISHELDSDSDESKDSSVKSETKKDEQSQSDSDQQKREGESL